MKIGKLFLLLLVVGRYVYASDHASEEFKSFTLSQNGSGDRRALNSVIVGSSSDSERFLKELRVEQGQSATETLKAFNRFNCPGLRLPGDSFDSADNRRNRSERERQCAYNFANNSYGNQNDSSNESSFKREQEEDELRDFRDSLQYQLDVSNLYLDGSSVCSQDSCRSLKLRQIAQELKRQNVSKAQPIEQSFSAVSALARAESLPFAQQASQIAVRRLAAAASADFHRRATMSESQGKDLVEQSAFEASGTVPVSQNEASRSVQAMNATRSSRYRVSTPGPLVDDPAIQAVVTSQKITGPLHPRHRNVSPAKKSSSWCCWSSNAAVINPGQQEA